MHLSPTSKLGYLSFNNTVDPLLLTWLSQPLCTRKVDFQERWSPIRVEIKSLMLRFTLSSGLSRAVGL